MRNSEVNDRLRDRTRRYLGRVPAKELRDDELSVMVLAPVEAGVSRFIDVTDLPDMKDIPFIPERMRDFAFRYATEYKPIAVFAKLYGVNRTTIEKWLRNEGVRAYIALCRYELRMFNMAHHVIMQRNVYKTINKILSDVKITGDTVGPIVSLAKFVYQVLTNPSEAPDKAKGTLNLSIGFANDSSEGNESSPYAQERDVSPKEIKALEAEIVELDLIAKNFKKRDGNGDE